MELRVFVDLVPKCMQTVYHLALGGCSEVAIATSKRASQCWKLEKAGGREKCEKEKGTDKRRGGLWLAFFSLKTCRLQLQNSLNGLIWYLFQTFQLHDSMTPYRRCTSLYVHMQ